MKTRKIILIVSFLFATAVRAQTPVGVAGRLDQVVIPGPEVEVTPHEDRKLPIRLRIVAVHPHGDALRYDLEYQGLQPGTFDLKDYLRRKDGSALDAPSIRVEVTPTLPPGQIEPNAPSLGRSPVAGGYFFIQLAVAITWCAGFFAIIYFGFIRRRAKAPTAEEVKPLSLADRLRPLVDGAIAGRLSQPELARLERTLIAYWRRRLHLENAEPDRAIASMRGHPEAGPLLEQLDTWLHVPVAARTDVDPARLLAPYQHLPPDALEEISS